MRLHRSFRIAAAGLTGLALTLGACETTSSSGDGYNDTRLGGEVTPETKTFGRSLGLERGPGERAAPAPAPAPRPVPVVRGVCNYSPSVGLDEGVVGLAFPTGDVVSSAIMLHQVMPMEVRRGAEFGYTYHVTNITNGTLQNVVVNLESKDNLEVISASPSPMSGGNLQSWALGDLGPCETRVISVNARANNVGDAANCVSVSYNNTLCAMVRVVDPAIALTKTATPNALLCDMIELTYEVCNTGSGAATGVVIKDSLPAGLTTLDGGSSINLPVGNLAAGECATRSVMAKASRSGEFASAANAMADGGLSADSGRPNTVVTQPTLAINSECRDDQFIGRTSTYTFNVTNNGDGVARNAVVTVNYPASASFQGASQGGVGGAGGTTFNLGQMAPGQTRTVSVDLASSVAGSITATAMVADDCAEPARTDCSVNYKGIPAILLEVRDSPDPVEVGQTTTYTIDVTNQGSAPGTGIEIICNLPDSQTYVSSNGPTTGNVAGQKITFGKFASLAPGQTITWTVTIRANAEEDSRFQLELSSDQFSRPIRETESTNLYR